MSKAFYTVNTVTLAYAPPHLKLSLSSLPITWRDAKLTQGKISTCQLKTGVSQRVFFTHTSIYPPQVFIILNTHNSRQTTSQSLQHTDSKSTHTTIPPQHLCLKQVRHPHTNINYNIQSYTRLRLESASTIWGISDGFIFFLFFSDGWLLA